MNQAITVDPRDRCANRCLANGYDDHTINCDQYQYTEQEGI